MYQYIVSTIADRVCYITLNRPDKRNAFNSNLVSELKAAFREAEGSAKVKVIILRANGDVFSAGADLEYLQQLQKNTFEDNFYDSSSLAELFNIIYRNKKVVIAQVEGHAIAGGCGLATVCDFTFAVPEANLGYTEVKIGFIPAIVSIFLLRKIGEGKARALLLTGKLISSAEAKEMGLINEVVAKEQIADHVTSFALQLCNETSGESLARTKELIAVVQDEKLDIALKYAAEMNAEMRATDECKSGIRSFLNKEKMKW